MDDLLTRLKDELDRIAVPRHDPVRIERRARALRRRRTVTATAATLVVILGVVVPLSALRHLGEERTPAPAAGNDQGWVGIDLPPTEGWFVYRTDPTIVDLTTSPPPSVLASTVSIDADPAVDADGTLTLSSFPDLRSLPEDGIVMLSSLDISTESPPEPNANFPAATLPLQLADADVSLAYEGQQDPSVPEYLLRVTAAGYAMEVRTYFGVLHPDEDVVARAQTELDRLIVRPRPDAIGFDEATGWHVALSDPRRQLPWRMQAWASSTPFAEADLPAGLDPGFPGDWPQATDKEQGPDDVLIIASTPLETHNPFPDKPDFQPIVFPIDLSAERVVRGPWEGNPSDDVSQIIVGGIVNNRYLILQVLFHTGTPDDALIARAQEEVDRLVVPPGPPPTLAIDQGGVRMNLPDGWQGRIFQYSGGGELTLQASTRPIDDLYDAHTAWEGMGPDDVVVVLGEDINTSHSYPQVDVPIVVSAADACVRGAIVDETPGFQDCEILDNGSEPPVGHTRLVRRFDVGDRAFTLWVELGTPEAPPDQIATVNDVLSTLEIDAA
jgi:hypothetical protein